MTVECWPRAPFSAGAAEPGRSVKHLPPRPQHQSRASSAVTAPAFESVRSSCDPIEGNLAIAPSCKVIAPTAIR